MKTTQLILAAAIVSIAAGCNRADTDENARRAAAVLRDVASRAGDQLADSWLTTKIQAQYFADEDIKARYINVSTRDGAVTLKGRVDSVDAREQALNIARYTDGVKYVDDRLTVGPARVAKQGDAASGRDTAVATTGMAAPAGADLGRTDDASVTAYVQSKFFLDPDVKGRQIEVDTHGRVVTLRGQVASDNERAKALLLARTTPGVERVEDALSVNAALAPASGPGSIQSPQSAPEFQAVAPATQSADAALTDQVRRRLLADPQVKAGSLDVTVKDGVLLLDGTVQTAAAKQRALTVAREIDGVVQVIDRLRVGKGRVRASHHNQGQ